MFRNVWINEFLPRDVNSFNSTFVEGLQPYLLFSYLSIGGGLIFLLIALFKFRSILPFVLIMIVIGLGVLSYNKWKGLGKIRKQAFLNGSVIRAEVIDHGRRFGLYDYSLTVSFKDQTGNQQSHKLVHQNENLWKENPIGKQLIGIEHNGYFFFGEEMGCNFGLFTKKTEK